MSYSDSQDDYTRPWCPPADVYRAEDHYVVKVDLPGLERSGITVTAKGNTLSITGDRSFEESEEAHEHLRLERLHGKFVCDIHLPNIRQDAQLEVGYTDGVLQVDVPLN